ncbi:hypothetical protein PSSM7_084 [Prochlorococcus phage P-SSM7]|uniref:Uncharacterized protein n=1 Tax=Prochlorococcus phage P-SSM7 TaxID=445688 RepID=E3SNK2_9CAUD|nr:baseplate wedge subunit [Prochlorococcus phage P-SSM7]ADO99019.1 hypothetical protein PSSM7_084 [Prochlorococcus phage P-SSM7]
MGCKTNQFTDICGRVHCYNYTAPNPPTVGSSVGVTIEYKEYPHSFIRDPDAIHSYNIPDRDNDAIMHPFYLTEYRSPHIPSATCGMATKTDPCSGGHTFGREEFDATIINLDFTPSMLSFDFQFSDTWFSYIYDTSDEAGHIGTAAYWLEDDEGTVTTVVLPTGTPGTPGYDPGSETNTYSGTTACIPCSNFTCTPAKTTLKYEGCEDLTGDPDCPHPTLFAIDTESLKIAFSYDQFATTVPNGVTDFELSFDGVTYADGWNATTLEGIDYNSSQNPWAYQDAGFSDFEIFDINDGANAADFRIKFRIESRYDDSAAPPESNTVMLGTKWTCTEILNNGTGFTVGQVFPLTAVVGLANGTTVNMTINLKVTAVGPSTTLSGGDVTDIMRKGDKINGHTITRTFHTEVGLFPYHIVYVDGSGSNFAKDTQYTSDRNHVITVKAGFGIADRAIMLGLYEFLDKSLQYVTGDVNQKAPDIFNSIIYPQAWISLNENGGITDINISGGVFKFNTGNFDDINPTAQLTGYATDEDIATTGGTGSGLTVDIEVSSLLDDESNLLVDRISAVRVNQPGTGYTVGDKITISGGAAQIQIEEITSGGANLDKLAGPPVLEITSPDDDGNFIPNKSTDDGEPEFILTTTDSNLKFEVVTKDGVADLEVVSDTGGNNESAKIKGNFSGGSLTSVDILRPGKGYSTKIRPQLVVVNVNEETIEISKNDGKRDDLVPEYHNILKTLPEGDIKASADDLQAITDSYAEVPAEKANTFKNAPMQIKLDPQRQRVHQRSQRKLQTFQTDPLKTRIIPDYDTDFLKDTPIDDDAFKKILTDGKKTSQDTVLQNIDDITQQVYPEFVNFDESKVETNAGSFTELPHASKYTKYLMRQYRPDPQKVQRLTVTLGCTPVNIGKSHFVCNQPTATPNTDTGVINNGDGTTTQEVHIFSFGNLVRGPGCQPWKASGTMTIWHDLTRDARTVVRAAQAYGNPYDE